MTRRLAHCFILRTQVLPATGYKLSKNHSSKKWSRLDISPRLRYEYNRITFSSVYISVFSQPSIYIDGWLYGMSMTSVVCNVPVLSQNDSTYHSVFMTWKRHPFATWTPSFIIQVRKLKKIPKNTNGRLAIPALAGLLVNHSSAYVWWINVFNPVLF